MVKAVYRDNTFHLIDPVNLQEGEEVELKILPDLEIKKLQGAFKNQGYPGQLKKLLSRISLNELSSIPDGTNVIIDTNIILYTALNHPAFQPSCTAFLIRV